MVNKIVNTTPITTKYTPKSKNSDEPIIPINGMGSSSHRPVIGGYPNNIGAHMLKAEVANPIGISDNGFRFKIFIVASVPFAKLCSTKAMDATSPPTNPPPG